MQLNGFKYFYVTLEILFNIIHAFAYSYMIPSNAM